jgi:PAS domain S-box-containing protein
MAARRARRLAGRLAWLGGAFALILIVGLGAAAWKSARTLLAEVRLVERGHEARALLGGVDTSLLAAESARRTLMLTGNESLRKSLEEEAAAALARLTRLEELLGEGEPSRAEVERLESLVRERIDLLKAPVPDAERVDTARSEIARQASAGQALSGPSRLAVRETADAVERRIVAARHEAERSGRRFLFLSGATGSLALLLLLAVSSAALLRAAREKARADAERRQAEELSVLYHQAPCGYHSLGPDGTFLRINDTELGWLGYSREEVVGRLRFSDLLTPDSSERFRTTSLRLQLDGLVRELDLDLVRQDGSRLPVMASAVAEYDAAGRFVESRSTVVDATERRRAEEELKQANRRLEGTVKELEAFAYTVSHDLRAPVRQAGAFAGLLRDRAGAVLDAQELHFLDAIELSTRKMEGLIEGLLAFARVGRTEIGKEPIALGPILADVVAEAMSAAGGRRIEWAIDPLPVVPGDPVLYRSVFQNLVGNAVKFTRGRDPAHIAVQARRTSEGEVEIRVIDDGAGFDMAHAGKLFGVFQRLHSEKDFEGTGIGLATVRRIVTRLGGNIEAEGSPGRGAVFTITLPGGGT